MSNPKTDPVLAARAQIGVASRTGDLAAVAEARKALAAAKLNRAINDALAHFPPLDADTKAAAAHLLMTGSAK